ncbi:hypothetical protein [Deinococcus humi]|uniref:Uncharacterized protein n=1 Tax=Deinococcus humi TaxID=662880 RepID=A0A7W8JTT3_9DEIO|nr:hypothetical protein [Deinococcus humi]MBB5363095.1 hypothetical protein [Deinococcus humi]GGO24710.1 hypothetical protein GCM10008949_13910 [Deinococcus humi]
MTATPARIDITGEQQGLIELGLSADARILMLEWDVPEAEIPEAVTLRLQEANGVERKLATRLNVLEFEKVSDDQAFDSLTDVLMRRAVEGTPRLALRAVVEAASQTVLAQLVNSFLTGEWPDPKAMTLAVRATRGAMAELALTTGRLGAPSPSTRGSTASAPGKSNG